ncbi:MAG: CotH kinase family protein [Verrucomicrobiales bacterium]|nr:CotH kinase family protein [Verrucomicrobiales bacterium]
MGKLKGGRVAWWLAIAAFGGALTGRALPLISEFMAGEQTLLADVDGDFPDWIEIHNPDPAPVNLAGHFLTDNPDQPARWRFPELTIEPGGYRVVFASGKDRAQAGRELHTNFRLDAGGEFLALVAPDGSTVLAAFAPAYPPQEAGISYGRIDTETLPDRLTTATIEFKAPRAADEVPAGWNLVETPPPAGWTAVPSLALGYAQAPDPGELSENLARNGTATQSTTGYNLPADLAIDGDPNTFTHTTATDEDPTWTLDLGAEIAVVRVVLHNRLNCCPERLRDITVSLLAPDGETVRWLSDRLNPDGVLGGPSSLGLDLFEENVGPVTARFVQVQRAPAPGPNTDDGHALSLAEVEVRGLEASSFLEYVDTDVTAAMAGRNASLFVRARFLINDPSQVDRLLLRLRHDAGCVVYLNGVEVFRRNAPEPLAWNSAATAERSDTEAALAELIDLGEFTPGLRPGRNLLAIQGLNSAADDGDFLLQAALLAGAATEPFLAHFEAPTPGAPNEGAWFLGHVADTRFSVDRGFFEAPFNLAITSETPGAVIRYTLDGSEPTESAGLLYEAPIPIERTTVVRAQAFLTDWRPTNIDTQTYLFPADVLAQPSLPEGFPDRWAGIAADYAMDPRITQDARWADALPGALQSLPSIAIATANDNLFGASKGIYANPESAGVGWERPCSIEWIESAGEGTFQVDCGIRIQGGYFRSRSVTQKHSLRLLFKDEYGPGKLRQDLFREVGAAREFDTLVLRAGANDGYAWDAAKDTEQFLRDEFGRRLHLAMGQPSPRGRFVHVYLNGLYWGLYNLVERPNEDFSSTYLGGEPEEWDAINSGEVKHGDLAAWQEMDRQVRAVRTLADFQALRGLEADGSRNPSLPVHLDLSNYVDYMIVNMWGGNWDWPNKNFWFGRRRTADSDGFKFYLWDFENTMGNNRGRSPLDMVTPRSGITGSWVAGPHDRLRSFPEYQLAFADHVHRWFFNDGVLTPGRLVPRYRALADSIESAVIAETARWGDDHHNPPQDLEDWRRERDWLLDTYLPQRSDVVLGQFRAAGLYPPVDAPVFSRHGGPVSPDTPLTMTVKAPELFFTTDGSDPRLPGGEPNPSAVRVSFGGGDGGGPFDPNLVVSGALWRYLDDGTDPGPGWRAADFDDSGWGKGASPLGYGDDDEATVVGYVDADPDADGVQKNATTYFRATFQLDDPAAIDAAALEVVYDDAVIVHLNGVEILRSNNLPPTPGFDTYALSQPGDNAVLTLAAIPLERLRAGRNQLAVEIHQGRPTSSDISFDLRLTASLPSTGTHVSEPLFLSAPTVLRARARQGEIWSALNEAAFTIDTEPASAANLVISEFCYRPAEPVEPAETAVTTNRDDFEFIELLNIGEHPIDLGGVAFVEGIFHGFAPGTLLAPGARLVVARNPAAFAVRYPAAPTPTGPFDGRLGNDGERLVLRDAAGEVLRDFTYNDRQPWPEAADGEGFSLVLIRPETNPDHAQPANWRASMQTGGKPGEADTNHFVGEPAADLNGNGRPDFLDYALGPEAAGEVAPLSAMLLPLTIDGVEDVYLAFACPRDPAADDARLTFEVAPSVEGPWRRAEIAFELLDEIPVAPRMIRSVWRSLDPVSEMPGPRFIRLLVTPR